VCVGVGHEGYDGALYLYLYPLPLPLPFTFTFTLYRPADGSICMHTHTHTLTLTHSHTHEHTHTYLGTTACSSPRARASSHLLACLLRSARSPSGSKRYLAPPHALSVGCLGVRGEGSKRHLAAPHACSRLSSASASGQRLFPASFFSNDSLEKHPPERVHAHVLPATRAGTTCHTRCRQTRHTCGRPKCKGLLQSTQLAKQARSVGGANTAEAPRQQAGEGQGAPAREGVELEQDLVALLHRRVDPPQHGIAHLEHTPANMVLETLSHGITNRTFRVVW
jgi:hypothetical protein